MIAVYFFAGILLVLLAAVLLAPAFERGGKTGPGDRLDAALETLRELEFEFESGKIGEDDYAALRAEYAAEAIAARDEAAIVGEVAAVAGACPVCDADPNPGAKFCARCGTAL